MRRIFAQLTVFVNFFFCIFVARCQRRCRLALSYPWTANRDKRRCVIKRRIEIQHTQSHTLKLNANSANLFNGFLLNIFCCKRFFSCFKEHTHLASSFRSWARKNYTWRTFKNSSWQRLKMNWIVPGHSLAVL